MKYEEKYKEALKVIESLYNIVKYRSISDALLTCQTIEKAFPELKESEDEKIRKKLLSSFKDIMENADEDELWNGLPYNDIISWLEKQCEQKSAWSAEDEKISTAINESIDFLALKTFRVSEDEVVKWIDSLKDRVQHQPKQEWSEEDEYNFTWLYETLIGFDGNDLESYNTPEFLEQCKKVVNWLKSLKDRVQPQLKQEWSEEDKNYYDAMLHKMM